MLDNDGERTTGNGQRKMLKDKTRSGLLLILTGALGLLFFWLTDPRHGPLARDASMDLLRAIHDATPGTYVGLAGSVVVMGMGVWLLTRRVA
jgi:hypothetical protein